MATASTSRLMTEYRDVSSQRVPVVFAQPEEDDILHWHAMIRASSRSRPLMNARIYVPLCATAHACAANERG